jgi:hypothetical protein
MLLASAPLPRRAVVLDYQILNSSLTNFCFLGDWTYSITGPVYLYGASNVAMGGSVIKYAAGVGATIDVRGKLIFDTDLYRPLVMTASDDLSYGESFGTGTPTGAYAVMDTS